MGEIEDAIERYTARKQAASIDPREMTAQDQAKLALSGLDLDMDEIIGLRQSVAEDLAQGIQNGIPLFEIVFGMWFEGVAIGVETEKGR